MKARYLATAILALGVATIPYAQEKTADEVARELANPNNALASLTFKSQFRSYTGDLSGADSQSSFTLLFQPAFPFTLKPTASGGAANLFLRPAFPLLVSQPTFDAGATSFESVTALGDIGFDVGYGVTEKSGLLWAYGVVGTIPTATDSAVAGDQLRLGPELLIAKFHKWGLYGFFPSHQWAIGGKEYGFSTSQAQLFLVFLPGGGWSVGTTPILSYDWKSNESTIPVNATVGKTIMAGKLPIKLQLEANYYVDQPDAFGPEWMIGFNVTPVVANALDRWIKAR